MYTPSTPRKALMRLVAGVSLVCTLLAPVGSAFADGEELMKIEGSTTVTPISTLAAPDFEVQYPVVDAQVLGTGSSTGLSALLADGIDVAMSSRLLKANELSAAHDFFIARDAVAIIVNPSKACATNITQDQVADIWEGTITNWSALGCPSETIVPRARETNSGTWEFFTKEHFSSFGLTEAEEAATISATSLPRLPGNPEMQAAIAANPSQIGYVGLGFLTGVRPLTLDGINPEVATVVNGAYPASRDLHMATLKSDPTRSGYDVDYVNYIRSAQGQAHVANAGFVQKTYPQIPDWDVNLDGSCNVLDLVAMTDADWLATGPYNSYPTGQRGWVREDVNNDGTVNVLDLVATTGATWLSGWAYPNG